MTKTQKISYYILLVLISALFLFSAYSKVTDNPMAEAGFTLAHLPIWFMYFIGIAEMCGAIGLWIPKLQKLAASGLFIILLGAIIVTAIFQSVPEAIFPLIAAIILGVVIKLSPKKI